MGLGDLYIQLSMILRLGYISSIEIFSNTFGMEGEILSILNLMFELI
jgi:hypothetical protein